MVKYPTFRGDVLKKESVMGDMKIRAFILLKLKIIVKKKNKV